MKRALVWCIDLLLYPLALLKWSAGESRQNANSVEALSVLVIEYWQMGDLVILLPFLEGLRRVFPRARVSLLASPIASALLDGRGVVDEILPLTVPWAKHLSRWRKYNPFSADWARLGASLIKLRRRRFDVALSGRMDIRDNFIMWVVGAGRRVGYGARGGAALLTDDVSPVSLPRHRVWQWLRLLEHLGVRSFPHRPRLQISPVEMNRALRSLHDRGLGLGRRIVGIHPGARIKTRLWGDSNFAALGKRLQEEEGVDILWFSEPNASGVTGKEPAVGVSVSLPLGEFMAVLSHCRVLVCNDSGPMHVASALGVPVVAIFGPQDPGWFGPLGEQDRVVYREDFPCRPCFDYCIYDQPYCLRQVLVEEVYRAAVASLRESERQARAWQI